MLAAAAEAGVCPGCSQHACSPCLAPPSCRAHAPFVRLANSSCSMCCTAASSSERSGPSAPCCKPDAASTSARGVGGGCWPAGRGKGRARLALSWGAVPQSRPGPPARPSPPAAMPLPPGTAPSSKLLSRSSFAALLDDPCSQLGAAPGWEGLPPSPCWACCARGVGAAHQAQPNARRRGPPTPLPAGLPWRAAAGRIAAARRDRAVLAPRVLHSQWQTAMSTATATEIAIRNHRPATCTGACRGHL